MNREVKNLQSATAKFRRSEVYPGKGHIVHTHIKVFIEHLTEEKKEHLLSVPFHLALFDTSSPKIKRELMDTISL